MDELLELALDLRWSWDHGAADIWRPLAPELWDITWKPWVILQNIAPGRLKELSANAKFRTRVERLAREIHASRTAAAWFQKAYPQIRLTTVAYFSMEFMLGEALSIYSGGLGNVAGDQLKAASDLGVPVVGIGLLYQEGYFRQAISADGSQLALYPVNDPGQLQIAPAGDANGKWVRLKMRLPAYDVWVRAWQAQVGRVLGDGREHGDDPAWDAQEAEGLYARLENEVVPAFYTRGANGIPTAWLAKMRESMARLTARFSASRAVRQYTEKYYLPAMKAFEARRADQSALGNHLVNWRRQIEQEWQTISFGDLGIETRDGQHRFQVEVIFGGVDAEALQVELFVEEPQGRVWRQPMARGDKLADRERGYVFTAQVPATRPAGDFTPRLIPYFPGVAVPLEIPLILWYY